MGKEGGIGMKMTIFKARYYLRRKRKDGDKCAMWEYCYAWIPKDWPCVCPEHDKFTWVEITPTEYFLRKKGLWKKFKQRYAEFYRKEGIANDLEQSLKLKNIGIRNAFYWYSTPEPQEYWRNLCWEYDEWWKNQVIKFQKEKR